MPASTDISTYALIAVPILFVLLWIGTSMLIAMMSGWHTLAKRFASADKPYGDVRTAGPLFHTVYGRYGVKYNSVIRMTAASDALYISVFAPFRAGHPPLRVPWEEIRIVPVKKGLRSLIVLSLGNRECVSFRVGPRTARKLGLEERMAVGGLTQQRP